MSNELPDPKPPVHPDLSEERNAEQRGDDPPDVVGQTAPPPQYRDPDPGYQPDPHGADKWRGVSHEISREGRPRREDVYPYLLIRALASGDRGARPTWPPKPCWESPDILLIDAAHTGAFDPSLLVASPTAGRSYRVFVRVWNLGLFPATGVHVKAWAVNPGFIGAGNQNDPYYQQNLIGGQWLNLADRTRPDCTALVELDRTWDIDPETVGHYCLLAEVSCPLDQAGGLLLSNSDRHVGQRNLSILAGPTPVMALIGTLGGLVPEGFTLELTHAGPALLGTLQALGGGTLPGRKGEPHEVTVPALDEIGFGISTGTSVHLLTAFTDGGRTVVAFSDRLAELTGVGPAKAGRTSVRGHPFDRPGQTRRLLEQLGPEAWDRVGLVTDDRLEGALGRGLEALLDLRDPSARDIAQRLGGEKRAQHGLRFTLTDEEANLVGGYTIVVS